MKKETRFLCVVLLCGLTLLATGCGIRPSKLMSPAEAEAEQERATQSGEPSKAASAETRSFPAVYPKASR